MTIMIKLYYIVKSDSLMKIMPRSYRRRFGFLEVSQNLRLTIICITAKVYLNFSTKMTFTVGRLQSLLEDREMIAHIAGSKLVFLALGHCIHLNDDFI